MLYDLAHYHGKYEVFNLSSNTGTSQNDVLDIIKDIIPDVSIKYADARSVDAKKIILDNTRIMEQDEFELVHVKDGIRNYYNYILETMEK